MMNRIKPLLAFSIALALGGTAPAQGSRPAKELFGAQDRPADLAARSIGFYSRGCMAGAVAMPVNGPTWQAMRLNRNRVWGHPALVDFLQWLSREAAAKDGWPGLLVGDMSQPRGGPMLTGHASHQIGLDADVWLTPMPKRRLSAKEREEISAVAVVKEGPHRVYPQVWTDAHLRLVRRAASHPSVERILVAPGIKRKLCEDATADRAWLRKVRPYYGHNYHMHVRLACPTGSAGCRSQGATAPGEGCGQELAWWFGPEPYRPAKSPAKPKKPMTLADLPGACAGVLAAAATAGTASALETFARAGGDVAGVTPNSASAPIEGGARAASSADAAAQPVPAYPVPRPRTL